MLHWQKLLRSLGFTDSEARIYLAALEYGPSPVQNLAQRANVSRVTAYSAIDGLMKDNLMSAVEKDKKKLYAAESPECLLTFMQGKLKNMETTLREMRTSLSDLELLQRGERPVVRVYEGREALKAIQQDALASRPEHVDEFGNFDELLNSYDGGGELPIFYDEFSKHHPRIRLIFLARQNKPEATGYDTSLIRLPSELYNFGGDIVVYGNKVGLSTFRGKQISVLIESEALAQTFRALFDYVWSKNAPDEKTGQKERNPDKDAGDQ